MSRENLTNIPVPHSCRCHSFWICRPGEDSVHVGTVVEVKPEPCYGRGRVAGREVSPDADAGEAFNRTF